MQNCETHFCPLAITNTLFPICPVEWLLERVEHRSIKDVIFDDGQLELILTDGLVITTERVVQRVEGGRLAQLEYEADEFLETFCGAKLIAVTSIPSIEPVDTCYLEVILGQPESQTEYSAIVEFFSLYSLDQNKPITYFGDEHGQE